MISYIMLPPNLALYPPFTILSQYSKNTQIFVYLLVCLLIVFFHVRIFKFLFDNYPPRNYLYFGTIILMIDQAEILLNKTEKIINKSKDTSSHSSPVSQEATNNHQEKMVDENELNDDHCFKCQKKGQLYCCDRCFRAFHKVCINTKRFSKFWNCEYCLHRNLCAQCQLPQLYTEKKHSELICTVCFRFVHHQCCIIPENVLNSQNYFFRGSDNFVCKGCIKQFGYKYILSTAKSESEISDLYYFVRINTRSPIHCGWFDEETLKQIPVGMQEEKSKEIEVFQVPKIIKILRMKVPLQKKQQDLEQNVNHLILSTNKFELKDFEYGGTDNFYFLVIWEESDYTAATWQDQKVLQYSEKYSQFPQLIKFLLYKKLQLTLKDKRPFRNIQLLFEKYLPASIRSSQFPLGELLNNFKQIKSRVNYILGSENYNETIDFLSYYIQQTYSKRICQHPMLLICGGSSVKWQRRIQELCPQLNIIALKGSEANIYQIKQKEMNYQLINKVKFHVLILPYEQWPKQKKYLFNKNFNFSNIIVDEFVPQNILDEIELYRMSTKYKRIYILDKFKCYNRQFFRNKSKLHKAQNPELQLVVHDLTNNRIFNSDLQAYKKSINILQQLKNIVDQNWLTFDRNSKWKELQRITFLQFVITYGFNCSASEMIDKLVIFSKGVFKSDDDRLEFNRYSQNFLAVLHAVNNPERRQQKQYFFMNFKPEFIYKRILMLYKLKSSVQKCKHSPQRFKDSGHFIIFQGIKSVKIKNWQPKHDYLLATLILEKGYGKWVEILQSKDWIKWASSCHLQHQKLSISTFSQYIHKILQPQCLKSGVIVRSLQQLVSKRAENILSYQDKQ